jgi:hypothetical protein
MIHRAGIRKLRGIVEFAIGPNGPMVEGVGISRVALGGKEKRD